MENLNVPFFGATIQILIQLLMDSKKIVDIHGPTLYIAWRPVQKGQYFENLKYELSQGQSSVVWTKLFQEYG